MLEIRLFGSPHILIDGAQPIQARSRPVEWLLALLTLRVGEPVTRSWLAGTLWPESSEEQALLNLRVALMRLRNLLSSESDRISAPDRRTLRLDLQGVIADVAAFDAAMARGDEESLRQAVDLYAGPLMTGSDRDWILLERDRRAEQYLRALDSLAKSALARGDAHGGLNYWRQVVAVDWTLDSAQRGIMRALEGLADSPAALLAYRDFRIRLWDEMRLEPDPDTVALHQEIQQRARMPGGSGQSQALRPVAGLGAPAGGRRQEPTVAMPANVPATSGGQIPQSAIRNPQSRIPAPLTALIGREEDAAGIAQAVRASRLVTLVGAGGIGKTRLAIEAATNLRDEFAGHASYIELAGLQDGSRIAAHLSSCLGVSGSAGADLDDLDTIIGALSGGKTLLVLDNCEHIVQAAAGLAARLLEQLPSLHILATSRERLGVTGEIRWRVGPLAVPETAVGMEESQRSPAIRLFIERARAAEPEFDPAGPEDMEAIRTICQRLDGMPLAIELAAARFGSMSLPEIARGLDDRFQLLTRGSRSALPRHQTLRALIDWSYDLLSIEERELLRRLSIFVGGWTFETAEAVCPPRTKALPIDLLTSLVDHSLVIAESRPVGTRYRMLETIREYASETLRAAGEDDDARQQMFAWISVLAERLASEILGHDPEPALDRLEEELANIRAALAWAREGKVSTELHLRLTAALWPLFEMRGHVPEGRNHLRLALSRPCTQSSLARANSLLGAGILAHEQNARDLAGAFCDQSLVGFRELGMQDGIASALLHMGCDNLQEGNLAAAREMLSECRASAEVSGWLHASAMARILVGIIARLQGEDRDAWQQIEEGLAVLRQPERNRSPFYFLSYLTDAASLLPDPVESRALLEACLASARERTDIRRVAVVLRSLAGLARRQQDWSFALACNREAAELHRGTGNVYSLMYTLLEVGNCLYLMGEYNGACEPYGEALDKFRSLGYANGRDTACNNLGSALFHAGDPAGARELHLEALQIFHREPNLDGISWSLERLAIVEARYGDPDCAARLMGAAASARQQFGRPMQSWDQADWNAALITVRTALGDETFERTFRSGQCASWRGVVEGLLGSSGRPRAVSSS